MVAKKRAKKKPVKKKVAKKVSKRRSPSKKKITTQPMRITKRKFNLVVRNLFFFLILCALSLILHSVCSEEGFLDLFFLLAIIFGFVAVAFFLILLVFLFMKAMKK